MGTGRIPPRTGHIPPPPHRPRDGGSCCRGGGLGAGCVRQQPRRHRYERGGETSKQTAATMATGSFPLSVSAVALGRVADLMQTEHALPQSVNVTTLAREMTR